MKKSEIIDILITLGYNVHYQGKTKTFFIEDSKTIKRLFSTPYEVERMGNFAIYYISSTQEIQREIPFISQKNATKEIKELRSMRRNERRINHFT